MKRFTKHPLYAAADIIKRAFITNGFNIYDDGENQEVLPIEKIHRPFAASEPFSAVPVLLEDGKYSLRNELLTAELPAMRGALPIKKLSCGRIYDKRDEALPVHLRIEGIFADKSVSFKDYQTLWNKIAVDAYGVDADAKLQALGPDSFEIVATHGDSTTVIGCTGPANWLGRSLLGIEQEGVRTWAFSIDVDTVALDMFGIPDRATLYCNSSEILACNADCSATVGDSFSGRVSDLLRKMGYSRYTGMRLYPSNIYVKMNMIQESWDSNNKGVRLVEPLGDNTGLPTVLAPAAEQALSDNYKAGAEQVKLYDIGHIFLPAKDGGAPTEKVAISICTYGPDTNSRSFKAEMMDFLKQLGINNHFCFPTNMAIAYDTRDTWLLLDERMNYLEGNLGGISDKAEKNFGIGTHAFMANFELAPLKAKSAEEYAFTPPETL